MRKPTTPFDKAFLRDGFLTEYPQEELVRVRANAPEAFDFAERLNRRLMEIMRQLKPRKSEPTEVLAMLLFVKALNAFQGGILLCQRGLLVESQALARMALECAIHLNVLLKEPAHVDLMLAAHDRHKKTHAEKLLAHHKKSGSSMSPEMVEELQSHTELKGDSLNLEQLAGSVGMGIAYDAMYRGTSGYAAHPTLGALQQLIGKGEKGEEVRIVFGGELSDMSHSMTNLALPMANLIDPVDQIFKLSLPLEGLRWAHELNSICEKEWKANAERYTARQKSQSGD